MLLLVRLGAYAENEVYTVFDQTKGEMTYYYDENRAANTALPNTIVEVYNPKLTRFKEYHDQIKTVKFNSTMQNAPLTSTKYLFCGGFEDGTYYSLTELTSVDDINNLNTENVEDMSHMFYGCEKLQTINLSTFNTSNVTDMSYLFCGCKALKNLTLPTDFNTHWVTDMVSMFEDCNTLTSLDLRKLDIANVTNSDRMFYNCTSLIVIYCDKDFSTSTKLLTSKEMFQNTSLLRGGKGTKYKEANPTNKTYARPDKDTTAPGYFTDLSDNLMDVWSEMSNLQKLVMDFITDNTNVISTLTTAMTSAKSTAENKDATIASLNQAITDAKSAMESTYSTIHDNFKTEKTAELEGLLTENDSQDSKDIVSAAVTTVDSEMPWDYDKSAADNISSLKTKYAKLLSDTQTALDAQRKTEAQAELLDIINEMKALYTFAQGFLDDKTMLTALQQAIDDATGVAINYSASLSDVKTAIFTAQLRLQYAETTLLNTAKTELKNQLEDMLKDGDSEACKKIVADAQEAIDALKWDNTKSVKDNTDALYNAAYAIWHDTDIAVKDQRKKDTGTGIDNTTDGQNGTSRKLFRNGQIIIIRDGKTINLLGAEI